MGWRSAGGTTLGKRRMQDRRHVPACCPEACSVLQGMQHHAPSLSRAPKSCLGTPQAASPHYLKGLQEEKAAGLSGVGRRCPPGRASVCTRCACASAHCSPGTEPCELTAGGGTRGAGLAGMEQKAPEPAQLLPAQEGGKGAETLTCLSSQTWKRHGAKYRHPAAQ